MGLYFKQDSIIGGDFNAGCSYVHKNDWDRIRLRCDERFKWLIGDNADTTVATDSQCPYDRFFYNSFFEKV